MAFLRALSATAVLVFAVVFGDGSSAAQLAPVAASPSPESAPAAEPKPTAPEPKTLPSEQKASASDRDTRTKERTPPPRPIVPPEGQQQNPALREECAWIGQRIVSLLFRDDAMSSNDFIPFYAQFGCPTEHLGKAFGCVVSSGSAENDVLADRIAACWTDPGKRPERPAAVPEKKAEPPAPPPKSAYGGGK